MRRGRYPKTFSKYGNIKTVGFHSKREAQHYWKLAALQAAGQISNLKKQVRFDLVVNGEKICSYYADFTYSLPDGSKVIDEVKGFRTDVFRVKWKLLQALYGKEYLYVLN